MKEDSCLNTTFTHMDNILGADERRTPSVHMDLKFAEDMNVNNPQVIKRT